ncbi:MAG: ATP-binding cassette domain-containing protein [Myxococcota bacterium]
MSALTSAIGDPLIAQGVSHWYGEGEARKQVLFDVDLSVRQGSLTILEGASGSGKTTLLTLLGCLRRLQVGSVSLLGRELLGADEPTLVERRHNLGFIFQAHNLHESLTAMQNVRMGLEVHGAPAMEHWRDAAEHLLTLLGLGDRLHYLPSRLSGGQKQRVAIARALVSNPAIVLADEPTAALDKVTATDVVGLLRRLGRQRGTTTLMVTHDTKVMDLAHRIVRMDAGRIVDDRPL